MVNECLAELLRKEHLEQFIQGKKQPSTQPTCDKMHFLQLRSTITHLSPRSVIKDNAAAVAKCPHAQVGTQMSSCSQFFG